jgi:thiol-disulfide isomerase/thioredoxin
VIPIKTGLLILILLASTTLSAQDRLDNTQLKTLKPLVADNSATMVGAEPVLLQFWASWCHSCAGIMWDMDELMQTYSSIQYLAVSLDEDPQNARDYIRQHALFEKYSDRYFHDENKVLAGQMGVETVPTILLIDGNGEVVVRKTGHLNSKDKQDLVSAMKTGL